MNLLRTLHTLPLALIGLLCAGCGTSIHDDVGRGDIEAVRAKIAADSTAVERQNELGKSPLHYAVSYKQLDLMKILVEAGADINAADRTGLTPLHVAAMLGRREETRWLLEQGASVDSRDAFGDTPLLTAAVFGAGGVVKTLLAHDADPAARNEEGLGAVELAKKYHQEKMAAYLEKQRPGS